MHPQNNMSKVIKNSGIFKSGINGRDWTLVFLFVWFVDSLGFGNKNMETIKRRNNTLPIVKNGSLKPLIYNKHFKAFKVYKKK